METKIFIGIDVSKDKFDYVAIDPHETIIKRGTLGMNREGFQEIETIIKSSPTALIGIESTSTYHINILSFMLSITEHVYLLNPVLVKKFVEADTLRKTKTDKVDALSIARFLIYRQNNLPELAETDSSTLTQLARLRESIARDIAKTKTHLKQYPSAKAIRKATQKGIRKSFYNLSKSRGRTMSMNPDNLFQLAKESIGTADDSLEMAVQFDVKQLIFLQKNLDEVTTKLTNNVNKRFEKQMNILKSIKGIGDTTASHFLSEVKDIRRFPNYKKLIAYAGTDPSLKQSGMMSKRGKISKRGSTSLRRVGYLITCSVIRRESVFQDYYLRKRKEGMPYRKAVIATWNKLLRVIFTMLKTNSHFNPNLAMNTNYL